MQYDSVINVSNLNANVSQNSEAETKYLNKYQQKGMKDYFCLHFLRFEFMATLLCEVFAYLPMGKQSTSTWHYRKKYKKKVGARDEKKKKNSVYLSDKS